MRGPSALVQDRSGRTNPSSAAPSCHRSSEQDGIVLGVVRLDRRLLLDAIVGHRRDHATHLGMAHHALVEDLSGQAQI